MRGSQYRPHHPSPNGRFSVTIGLLLSVFTFVPPCGAQGAAKVKIDSAVVDFGRLTIDDGVQEKTISVANEGTDTLRLDFISSTCGCTKVQEFTETVLPGNTGKIVLVVDPRKAEPRRSKFQRVLFSTNDPEHPQLAIEVYWKMKLEEVTVSPSSISVDLSKMQVQTSSGRAKDTIVVLDTWQHRLEITDIKTSSHLTTSLYDIMYTCPQGSKLHLFRFDICLLPNTPTGVLSEWLKFSTNHPRYPIITVPITGRILGTVEITPKILLYRNLKAQSLATGTVTIEATGNSDTLQIKEVSAADFWLTVEKVPINPKRVDLKISVNPSASSSVQELQKVLKSKITIKLQKPDVVEETVDVMVFYQ